MLPDGLVQGVFKNKHTLKKSKKKFMDVKTGLADGRSTTSSRAFMTDAVVSTNLAFKWQVTMVRKNSALNHQKTNMILKGRDFGTVNIADFGIKLNVLHFRMRNYWINQGATTYVGGENMKGNLLIFGTSY